MNPLSRKILNRFMAIVMVAIIVQGCDDMNTDTLPPEEEIDAATNIASTLAVNGPVLIDLVQTVKLTGNASISIIEEPTKGTLTILNSALLKYTPLESFTSGSDKAISGFVLTATATMAHWNSIMVMPLAPVIKPPYTTRPLEAPLMCR